MGGGHVSRPDFGMPQPDPNHPLTEFYLALQHALDKEGSFALPALYAGFQAPARRVYADEAAEYLTLSSTAGEGMTRLLAPGHLQLLYSSLHVMPDGAPAALLLTEECTRTVVAVQLLPPFVWEDPLPPLPDTPAALTLTLTMQDVEAIDTDDSGLLKEDAARTPPRWGGGWWNGRRASAGCTTREWKHSWRSGWPCSSGSTAAEESVP